MLDAAHAGTAQILLVKTDMDLDFTHYDGSFSQDNPVMVSNPYERVTTFTLVHPPANPDYFQPFQSPINGSLLLHQGYYIRRSRE